MYPDKRFHTRAAISGDTSNIPLKQSVVVNQLVPNFYFAPTMSNIEVKSQITSFVST